ncbi:MAG: molybdenum cofactor biosynthesis protein B [Candidatus Bathyarchaeia archaeon]
MSLSYREHKSKASGDVRFGIVTCSSSRSEASRRGDTVVDESGDLSVDIIARSGFHICYRKLIPDNIFDIRYSLVEAAKSGVDILVFIGGTGVSPTDVTVEALKPMMEREVPGFGELFRKVSFDEIGSGAMLSRAFSCVAEGMLIFALPGSPHAVALALEKLIIPEAKHLILHVRG